MELAVGHAAAHHHAVDVVDIDGALHHPAHVDAVGLSIEFLGQFDDVVREVVDGEALVDVLGALPQPRLGPGGDGGVVLAVAPSRAFRRGACPPVVFLVGDAVLVVDERGLGVLEVVVAVLDEFVQFPARHELGPQAVVGLLGHVAAAQQLLEEGEADVGGVHVLEEVARGFGDEVTMRIAAFVAERPVEVPDGAQGPQRVGRDVGIVDEPTLGVHEFLVADEVGDEHGADHSVHVEQGRVVVLLDGQGERVEGVLYLLEPLVGLFLRDEGVLEHLFEVGFLQVDVEPVVLVAELVGFVVVRVEFEHDGVGLVLEVDAVVVEAGLLGEVVRTAVVAVDVQFYGYDVVAAGRAHHVGHLHGQGIGGHGARLLVAEQHPRAAVLHAQGLLLLVELQPVGVLAVAAVAPTAVASAANQHGRLLHVGEHAAAVDADGGLLVVRLAVAADVGPGVPRFSVVEGDVDARHLVLGGGVVGEEVDPDHVVATEGHEALPVLRR